jgi:2,3-bisphosphoglycerate-independent phosphoglycerate mutase
MHILLFFIDGLGLGENNPAKNPLVTAQMPTIRKLLQGHAMTMEMGGYISEQAILLPTDATLGVDGLPQSATGQTALFTGLNAAKQLGRHLHAFPTKSLQEMLAQHSILKQVKEMGGTAVSANAYTPNYLTLVAQRKRRNSASTLAILAADIPLNMDMEKLRRGLAVYQDLTNHHLQEMGFDINLIQPEQAGENLAGIVKGSHFTLFEYFQTDIAGHKQKRAEELLENIDRCLGSLLNSLDLKKSLVILTSDHGNIEDLSVKTHTRNPVPTLLIGNAKVIIANRIKAITDITPAIMDLLKQTFAFKEQEG